MQSKQERVDSGGVAATAPGTIHDAIKHLCVPVGQLRHYDDNPRRGNMQAIRQSLEYHGQFRPLVVRRADQTVLCGNHTLAAARDLGWDQIAVTYVDVDDDEAARIVLVDNRTNDLAGYDDEGLTSLLQSLPDLAGTGYSGEDLDGLLAGLNGHKKAGADAMAGDEEIPAPPADPVCRPGDLWALGPHRLLCGDARREADYQRLLGSARARLCVTSPPYNQSLETFRPSGMMKDDGANERFVHRLAGAYADSLPEEQYQDEQVAVLELIRRFMTPDGSIFYNHKVRYREKAVVHPMEWIRRLSFPLRQEIIWDRGTSITLNARMFVPAEERLYWLRCGEDFCFNDETDIKSLSTVWSFGASNDVHVSAPFARELPLRCIRAASRAGDVVLDPYLGSGTTLCVAHEMDRLFAGLEINPAYVDVCIERFRAETGIEARKVSS